MLTRGGVLFCPLGNRVCEFVFKGGLDCSKPLVDVKPCPHCFAKWVMEGSTQFENLQGRSAIDGSTSQGSHGANVPCIAGLQEALGALQASETIAAALAKELETLGAVSTNELTTSDWESLEVWGSLRPLQKRRLLQHLKLG